MPKVRGVVRRDLSVKTAPVRRAALAADTSIGQHFLKNPAIVQGIVDHADIRPSDTVLEIGPGTGNLTVRLLEKAKKVVAIEFDRRMIQELLKRVEGSGKESQLQVIHGDVLKVDIPFFDVCVANIPYQISSPLFFKLMEHKPLFRHAVIMFQDEFAQRLFARPGDAMYCRLSVNAQLLSRVESIFKVNRANFRPPPKVDSRVVRITPISDRLSVDSEEFDGLVRLIFSRRHKILKSIFWTKSVVNMLDGNRTDGNSGVLTKPLIMEVLLSVNGEDFSTKRGANLSQSDLLNLLLKFNEKGIHFRS